MIQRIQSVFLFLAALSMGLLFVDAFSFITIAFGDISGLQAQQSMLADTVFEVSDHVLLLALVVLSIVLALATIFSFKKRTTQLKLGRFMIISIVLVVFLSILLFYLDFKKLAPGTEVTVEYGYLLPVSALIFTYLGIRAIRKDESLVRSSNRLR